MKKLFKKIADSETRGGPSELVTGGLQDKARYILKNYLPIVIVVAAIFIVFLLQATAPRPPVKQVSAVVPVVEVQTMNPETVRVPIYTQGTVAPRTEIELASEIGGRVIEVSPNMVNGGYFKKDEVLVTLDPIRAQLEVTQAKAAVATANLNLTQAKARGAKALLEEASASLEAARASLKLASLNLDRTKVRAPFDGLVKAASVDLGQFVSPGMTLGKIYAIDAAEIRLPVSDKQFELIDLNTRLKPDAQYELGPEIIARAQYGGQEYAWFGRLVRWEGSVNEENRLIYVVAEILDPYAQDDADTQRPPLAAGTFVEVEIKGKPLQNVMVFPRRALRGNDEVWTIDQDQRLRVKQIHVVYRGRNHVYSDRGLAAGDQLVTTPLDVVVEGMQIRLAEPRS